MNDEKNLNQIFTDLFKQEHEDEIPCIYAKRNRGLGGTYDIKDKFFEGLKRVIRAGRVCYEVDDTYSGLVVNPKTGFCKIHQTDNNMKRFELLSKPQIKKTTVRVMDPATGSFLEREVEETIKPFYERLDKSIVQRSVTDDLLKDSDFVNKLLAKFKENLEAESPAVALKTSGNHTEVPQTNPEPVADVMERKPVASGGPKKVNLAKDISANLDRG